MNNNTLKDAFNRRYATKIFDTNKTITSDDLDTLIDSLIYCPSSYGLQPWHFVIVQNDELQSSLVDAAYGQQQVADCDTLFILCRKNTFDKSDIEAYISDMAETRNVSHDSLQGFESMMKKAILERPESERLQWVEKQIYIALGFLLETAALLHIDACPMEGFIPEDVSSILGLEKQGLHPVLLCPVGYRSDNDETQERKKVRYSREEIVTKIQ